MIEVSVRLLAPNEGVGREIGSIRIVNDGTGDWAVGNYDAVVYHQFDDALPRQGLFQTARIEGHKRAYGWAELLRKVLEQAHG